MAEGRVARRLAAILAADIVGYSRLMGTDEEATLAALKECRRELIDPKIAEHGGRIVKTTGDGALVEFSSAVDAVRCAVDIQRAMAERNTPVPENRRVEFRVGINVGDIIIEEGDIFGDGVNIAARLEGISDPGGICISDDTFRQVRDKVDISFDDAGEHQLKNITRPVRIYRARLDKTAPARGIAPISSNRPSIAVLPFQNMSGDPEQEYFADGTVDEIITGLSRIKWLSVVSRNSSFIYKNKPITIKEVANKLGVRYVLEGGVRKSGNRIRITAQLIDAERDAHLWAEQYDRLIEDVFALQDEITMCVVGAIEPSLRKAELDRIKRQRPNSFDAYDLVLRSQPLVFAGMPKEAAKAIPLLEEALKLEPDYSAAHAYLSWCLHSRYGRGGLHEEDRLGAVEHARAAVALGNDDAAVLAVAALVLAYDDHDTATALKVFDRALELSNCNIFVLCWNAAILAWTGRTALAIERAQLALRLGPFDSLRWRANHALAVAYFHDKKYSDAAEAARNVIDANPVYSLPRAFLVAALVRLGRIEEAKATAKTVMDCDPSFTIHGTARYAELEPAVFRPFAEAWREAGLPE
jgi:TolB-like protein/class 3 adenylate cyclase